MSPMYAACTSQMVKPQSDLVFVEFVQNDLHRGGGALFAVATSRSRAMACLRALPCVAHAASFLPMVESTHP